MCTAAIRRVAPFALAVALSLPTGVQAADQVGNFGASGFIFKDSVEVVAVEDPDGECAAPYPPLRCACAKASQLALSVLQT